MFKCLKILWNTLSQDLDEGVGCTYQQVCWWHGEREGWLIHHRVMLPSWGTTTACRNGLTGERRTKSSTLIISVLSPASHLGVEERGRKKEWNIRLYIIPKDLIYDSILILLKCALEHTLHLVKNLPVPPYRKAWRNV